MTPRLLSAALLAVLVLPAAPASPDPRTPVTVTPELVLEFRKDPDAFFFDLRHIEAIAVARDILADPAVSQEDKAAAVRTLGQIYAVLEAPDQARAAFTRLFEIDPSAELEPAAAYPPAVVKLFYSVKDARAAEGTPPSAPDPSAGIHTLAVGPMDNQSPSLPGGKFDLDRFAAGLTQMVTSDLMPATSLKVVDRQRLDVLRSEIQLSNSGFADPAQAVRAGRLLGAQSYLFGSLIMLPNGLVRIDLRLVETETGRVLLAESREKKIGDGADLLKLESDIVLLLAKKLDQVTAAAGAAEGSVSKAARESLERRKKESDQALQLVDLTGAAILAEDQGQLDKALDLWSQVSRLEPENSLAATRVRALETGRKYASLEEGAR
jgi:curli biogenesis system outer membrane secretion channel CsgG